MENNEFWKFFLQSVEIPIPFENAIINSLENGGKITPELEEWLANERIKEMIKYKYKEFEWVKENGEY